MPEARPSGTNGKPQKLTEEQLAWLARVIAMQTLHHLRLKIKDEGLKSRDDLARWAQQRYANYFQERELST
jgi:transposase